MGVQVELHSVAQPVLVSRFGMSVVSSGALARGEANSFGRNSIFCK